MSAKQVRRGFQSVVPYLAVRNASTVVKFLIDVLAAELTHQNDSHHEVRIGDSMVMIGEIGDGEPKTAMLMMYVTDAEKIYHRAIGAGATSLMEPCDQPYGENHDLMRSAAFMDSGGSRWYVASPL